MKFSKVLAALVGFLSVAGSLFFQLPQAYAWGGVPLGYSCSYDPYWDSMDCSFGIKQGSNWVVADQDTANLAATAAQQAATAAQQAATAANNTVQYAQQAANAANAVNAIVNSTLTVSGGVVQDNSGTVLQAARQARDAAQQASSKLDNVQNAINKVQNTITNINQYLPPTLNKISGLNGASATSSGVLQVVIDASNATQYSYRIDSGGWSPWMPIQDTVSIPVPKGVHTLTIQVANGPVGTPGPAAKSSMQVVGL